MKKFFMAGAVVLAAAASMVSCSKQAENTDSETTVSKEVADSVAVFYGRAYAANIANYISTMEFRQHTTINRNDIIKGMQYVMSANGNEDFITGMKIGMQMKEFLSQGPLKDANIPADVVVRNFREVLSADSIDEKTAKTDYEVFTMLMNRMEQVQMEKQMLEQEKTAKENLEKGAAYVENAKKNDSAIQTSESGLSYKIENAGEEPKIGPNDTARVKYTGKLIDGTVFDAGEAEFAPGRVVAGFGEGMQMLGKGGKATLYIPANLGYGANGAGQIGPNATLIFDVEIIDVRAAE